MAKSCQGALKLANHPEELQRLGYLFGRNLALAWQAYFDLKIFQEQKPGPFSLIAGTHYKTNLSINIEESIITAPVMFHLQDDPDFYSEILKGSNDVRHCDYDRIVKIVGEGPGIKKTQDLKQEFVVKCLEVLDGFKDTKAKHALQNIVNVL